MSKATVGFAVVAGFSFVINLLMLVSPIYSQQIFDRVLVTHRMETLIYLSLLALVLIGLLGLMDTIRQYALGRIGRWWEEGLRTDVLNASLTQSRLTGRLAMSAVHDLSTVRNFIGSSNVTPFFDAPWTPIFLILCWALHPVIGLITTVGALLLFALAVANDRLTRPLLQEASEKQMQLSSISIAAMRHADTVHAMAIHTPIARRYARSGDELANVNELVGDRSAVIQGISKAVRFILQSAVMGVGAYLVSINQLTAGGMIAASIILGRAVAPAEQAIGAWRMFVAARDAHARLTQLFAAVPAQIEPTQLPAPTGVLSVENVSFTMRGMDRPVLRGVSFKVEPGQVLALIGPSASGKSTLCKLLVGSWMPASGHVRIDGAVVDQWPRETLGRHLGYVPQAVEMFAGSVKDNIARLEEPDDAAVVAAAQTAGCHEMILRLPKGYDTDIGEAGQYLSGGQRQRIALARALYREPSILILDEPNSNLDAEGEAALATSLAQVKARGCTVVVVSHRLALLSLVDTIALMREGAIEKLGTKAEVMAYLREQQNPQNGSVPLRPAMAAPQPPGFARPAPDMLKR